MKLLINFVALSVIAFQAGAADTVVTNESKAIQKEQLFQRFLKEMRERQTNEMRQWSNSASLWPTNLDTPSFREIFFQTIVDPSFGLHWDEVPAPTLMGSNAMSAVNAFVAANGWNMQTNDCVFDCIFDGDSEKSKPIRGLPWSVIQDKEFSAVTHDGILYVLFGGFHHDGHGVAYNPQTNRFTTAIDGFKPIGQHWYVWIFDHEDFPTPKLPQQYEGSKPSRESTQVSK